MKAVEFLKIAREMLKLMSVYDLRREDYKHIELYDDYTKMRGEGVKVDYILSVLSSKYGVSESTVKRIVRRFSKCATLAYLSIGSG